MRSTRHQQRSAEERAPGGTSRGGGAAPVEERPEKGPGWRRAGEGGREGGTVHTGREAGRGAGRR